MLAKKQEVMADLFDGHIIEVRVDGKVGALAVLSDIHQGLNDRAMLQKSVDFLLKLGENVKVIVGGDCTNSNTRASKGCPTEEWVSGDGQVQALVDDIMPLKETGQLVGIISGNHTDRVKKDTFINVEMMVACLLGDKSLYKGSQAICYFNVNKNLYVHYLMHRGMKKEHNYDYFNADVTWLEHYHKPSCKSKIIVDHNKYVKKPVVRECWDIFNGSFQGYPEYAKRAGYRPYLPGFYVVEMGGDSNGKWCKPTLDHHLYHSFKNGYRIS